jgi:predicted nucleic acid-binding protein
MRKNTLKGLLCKMYQLGAFDVFEIAKKDKNRLLLLMQQYADLPMDFADASLVLLAEQLGHGRILSTDKRDFHTYRWKNMQPFSNLLCT